MTWFQTTLHLSAKPRGFHLVTSEILRQLPQLREFNLGIAHFFIQHTSASLALNENADPTVRHDLEAHFNQIAPENMPYFKHTLEGPDDMPAHIKAILIGESVSVPITHGKLNLGTWQGIYLCEHRDYGGERRIVVTLNGERN